MPMRWGMGPVFFYESLINARRWQVYAWRAIFVLVLLVGMTAVWLSRDQVSTPGARRPATFSQLSEVGKSFFFVLRHPGFAGLLAAPQPPGTICVDRAERYCTCW